MKCILSSGPWVKSIFPFLLALDYVYSLLSHCPPNPFSMGLNSCSLAPQGHAEAMFTSDLIPVLRSCPLASLFVDLRPCSFSFLFQCLKIYSLVYLSIYLEPCPLANSPSL